MTNMFSPLRIHGRRIVLAMALSALGLGLIAVVLAEVLRLSACHLCIFQRLVHFLIGVVLLLAFWLWRRKKVCKGCNITSPLRRHPSPPGP